MSYRYLYHVRVTRSDYQHAAYLRQLRNEPITGEFYRDVLRWYLNDACPWRDQEPGPDKWVECSVYRAEGPFDDFPSPTLFEEDMTPVARLRWDRFTLESGETVLRKIFTDLRPDCVMRCVIKNGRLVGVYNASFESALRGGYTHA